MIYKKLSISMSLCGDSLKKSALKKKYKPNKLESRYDSNTTFFYT